MAHVLRVGNYNRSSLHKIRHRLQINAAANQEVTPLTDEATETDEAYQNAGEKGISHLAPEDPPRKRANKKGLSSCLRMRPSYLHLRFFRLGFPFRRSCTRPLMVSRLAWRFLSWSNFSIRSSRSIDLSLSLI